MKLEDDVQPTTNVYRLRAKSLGYSVIQYTGWAILFYAIHQITAPIAAAYGYPIGLPQTLATAIPALGVADAVLAMFAGIILVWISTASWF